MSGQGSGSDIGSGRSVGRPESGSVESATASGWIVSIEREDLLAGIAAGGAIHLLTYLLAVHHHRVVYVGGGEQAESGVWTFASWVFFRLYGIGLERGGGPFDPELASGSSFYIIPILAVTGVVLLAVVGYHLSLRVDPDGPVEAVTATALSVPGCVFASVALARLSIQEYGDEVASVPVGEAVLYAGVIYPLACGLVGAAAYWWRRRW